MFNIARGANRLVILTRNYALKVPTFNSWRDFLFGLLNNQTETRLGRSGRPGYCPVVFALPGGFLTVMPRVKTMTEAEFRAFDSVTFCQTYAICAEHKPCSYGWLNGEPVAVDYGWEV